MTTIEWVESEWNEGGSSAYVEPGVTADVYVTSHGWFWRTDLTSAVSETPECWSLGLVETEAEAKEDAEDSIRTAVRALGVGV